MGANTALATDASRLSAKQNVENYAKGVSTHVNGDWERHYQLAIIPENWIDSCGDIVGDTLRLRIPLTAYNTDVNVVVPLKLYVPATSGSAPSIVTQPVSTSVGSSETARFFVTASGAPALFYQWFKNGNPIEGATSNQFAITNAALADAGDYTVQVGNDFGLITSNVAKLIVVWNQQNWHDSSFWEDVTDVFTLGLV